MAGGLAVLYVETLGICTKLLAIVGVVVVVVKQHDWW